MINFVCPTADLFVEFGNRAGPCRRRQRGKSLRHVPGVVTCLLHRQIDQDSFLAVEHTIGPANDGPYFAKLSNALLNERSEDKVNLEEVRLEALDFATWTNRGSREAQVKIDMG